jgi:hypothetical protein
LDFSSSNWIFFINKALTSQRYTVKFPSLYFWTSSTNFWPFSGRSGILFSLLIIFLIYFLIDLFSFLFFCARTQKWVATRCYIILWFRFYVFDKNEWTSWIFAISHFCKDLYRNYNGIRMWKYDLVNMMWWMDV